MIFIACPEKFATGGTELLYQFYYKLRKFTENVRIYYYNYSNTGTPINERFMKYNVNYVVEIIDSPDNILIVPEISTNLFNRYKKVKKCIWWLSIDFYYSNSLGIKSNLLESLVFITKRILKKDYFNRFIDFADSNILHLAQSYYALDFLKRKDVKKIEYLSDYIGTNFLNEKVALSDENRKNYVLYNPKKGIEFTKKIIEYDANIVFIPLINMNQVQIIELCKTSKVYIDFGNHPGKDRFPREASYLGCVIITGRRGSAKFFEDVMIPDRYKIDDKDSNVPLIVNEIKNIFSSYCNLIHDFDEYREMIKKEEQIFESDVAKVWNNHLCEFVELK